MAVCTSSGNQLVMCSLFGNFSILKDNNVICISDGVKPVGDHNCGFSPQEVLKRKLYLVFILNIRIGGCLVKNDNRRVFQNRPCDRDSLLLAAGQFRHLF